MSRTALLAALAALAFLALPLVSAQSGPPPGYTDPIVYAQDYAVNQTEQAKGDPVGYASGKATPAAIGNETEHAAWFACWTLYAEAPPAEMAADPVCSKFFVPPGIVDAPAEAQAQVTQTLNGTSALTDNVTSAAGAIVDDPTSAPEQAKKLVGAVVDFVHKVLGGFVDLIKHLAGGVVDLVVSIAGGILDMLGLGGVLASSGMKAVLDGLLALVGLPALGLKTALEGIGGGLGAASHGLGAAASGLAAGVQALAGALVAGLSATASAAGSGLAGVGDALAALGRAVADGAASASGAAGHALHSAADGVHQAASEVGRAVGHLFGAGKGQDAASGSDSAAGGLKTGTPADRLVDRILHLV